VRRKRGILASVLAAALIAGLGFPSPARALKDQTPTAAGGGGLCAAAARHTGRPYVWGAVGLKSFDCSGYLWRTFLENGVLVKRTTARKFYMCLQAVPESLRYSSDTIVFFDNLKHVGIVNDDSTFYHAQSSKGTNLSRFNSFWRRKIYGFRRLKD
jgi:cell wall-associated NlpC family hydrolase